MNGWTDGALSRSLWPHSHPACCNHPQSCSAQSSPNKKVISTRSTRILSLRVLGISSCAHARVMCVSSAVVCPWCWSQCLLARSLSRSHPRRPSIRADGYEARRRKPLLPSLPRPFNLSGASTSSPLVRFRPAYYSLPLLRRQPDKRHSCSAFDHCAAHRAARLRSNFTDLSLSLSHTHTHSLARSLLHDSCSTFDHRAANRASRLPPSRTLPSGTAPTPPNLLSFCSSQRPSPRPSLFLSPQSFAIILFSAAISSSQCPFPLLSPLSLATIPFSAPISASQHPLSSSPSAHPLFAGRGIKARAHAGASASANGHAGDIARAALLVALTARTHPEQRC
jgi:hypothetical protein